MHSEFSHWLNYVMELHEACQEQPSNKAFQFRTYADKKEALNFMEVQKNKELEEVKKIMDKFQELLGGYYSTYIKKLESMPSG